MRILNLLIVFAVLLSIDFSANSQEAIEIIERFQEANSFQDLSSKVAYRNVSKKGRKQERELEQYIIKSEMGSDQYKFLLSFTKPGDVAGTSTLTIQHSQRDDDQWLYLPALRTVRKISASKKSDRFMGTEMTYEDLSNYLSEPIEEYDYNLMGEEKVGERTCYRIEALPRSETKSQYTRKELWIDTGNFVMLRIHFFNDQEQPIKVFEADDVRQIEGSTLFRAHEVKIENMKTGNYTEVSYSDFMIDQGIDKQKFSKAYLESQ